MIKEYTNTLTILKKKVKVIINIRIYHDVTCFKKPR
jgi:hypothetical protein